MSTARVARPPPQVLVHLLGSYAVEVDGRPVPAERWNHRRAAELVELLALEPRHRLHREQVVDALWPHLPAAAGACNLHKAAHLARRVLRASDAVVLRGGHVELWPGARIATDVESFEAAARAALAGSHVACRRAASLYAGDLLPDERYEEWASGRREHLRGLLVEVLRQGGLWERLLEHEPADEEAHRELMRRHAERGDRAAALAQFERLRRALAPLGLAPSPSSETLRWQIAAAGARPPIRYARSNGLHVAYEVDGPPDAPALLWIPGWVSHLALDRDDAAWCAWAARLTSFARLVRFDKVGTGLSDRPAVLPAPAQRAEDARHVLDAAGVRRAYVLGALDGGPLAVLLAVRHRERIAGLVLTATASFGCARLQRWGNGRGERSRTRAVGPERGPGSSRRSAYQRAARATDALERAPHLGIHYRFATVAGEKLGRATSHWVLRHAFQPVRCREGHGEHGDD